MAALTVKGAAASAAQRANITLLCQKAKAMGATAEQMAGAHATMTQESSCVNLQGGDRDSAGLFQQRPSAGWGSYAQVTNPSYAIAKFLTPYLNYCRHGHGVLDASNLVQRSAFPTAPARWLPESRHNVSIVMGSGDFSDVTALGGGGGFSTKTTTRVLPYEFSRGNAGAPEDSWTCMGRLADEVGWRRFMRGGVLTFASEKWLARQSPRFVFAEGARGVLSITHNEDARRRTAEATVTALADRWSVLPGDVVQVTGQGPADGLWLVSDTRRSVYDATTDITLKRPAAPKPEPANQTQSTSVNVGGLGAGRLGASQIGGGAAAGPSQAQRLYNAAQTISNHHYPYVMGGGHGSCGVPSGGGFDCSGSVCAALGAAGLGYHLGGPVDTSGTMAARWGMAGRGRWFTVWANAEHVWVQFTGVGLAWRFDTSSHGCGDDGARLRSCPRSSGGFTPRRWPGL